jgi:peroxiredoxin
MWGRKAKVMVPPGDPAPAFELSKLRGSGKQSLAEVLKSGPALFVFYKIGCPVCQLTAPFLERLAASPKLQIVGVSQDDDSSTEGFNQRFGVTFPTLLDQAKEGYPASNAYGISSVPSLFLVEQDGRVSKSFNGFSKRDIEELGERAGVMPFRPDENVPEWKAG